MSNRLAMTWNKSLILRVISLSTCFLPSLSTLGQDAGETKIRSSEVKPFVIKVVDEVTGRGVPLVKLETVHHRVFYTDSAGVVAFQEPGLMGRKVFFHVSSHGYEFPQDGFKFRGKALEVVPGGMVELKIRRVNIAERLYRITGAGIYAESVKANLPVPIKHPLINSSVMGSDSILSAIYRGRAFWIWGDTNQVAYPLGNFQVTAATSALPGKGGLDPDVGINLEYFSDEKGFTRKMAPLPGKGPTWLGALTSLKDKEGQEQLVATYVKVEPPLSVYERGLCVYHPDKEEFEGIYVFSKDEQLTPNGHPFTHRVDEKEYIYYGNPFPDMRIPASFEAWKDPGQYEEVKADYKFTHPETKKAINAHYGSVAWNSYLKKWIAIFTEKFGESSALGEIWFASADAPEGPWRHAVKIMTHDHYSFYNPRHHPFLNQEDGRVIYFEGTYTKMFSSNPVATPRYDYNQIMYRLDLGDERLRGSE